MIHDISKELICSSGTGALLGPRGHFDVICPHFKINLDFSALNGCMDDLRVKILLKSFSVGNNDNQHLATNLVDLGEVRVDGWIDGWMDGGMDEQIDGWMNNWRLYILLNSISVYQDDGQNIIKGCVQWNPVGDSKNSPSICVSTGPAG